MGALPPGCCTPVSLEGGAVLPSKGSGPGGGAVPPQGSGRRFCPSVGPGRHLMSLPCAGGNVTGGFGTGRNAASGWPQLEEAGSPGLTVMIGG